MRFIIRMYPTNIVCPFCHQTIGRGLCPSSKRRLMRSANPFSSLTCLRASCRSWYSCLPNLILSLSSRSPSFVSSSLFSFLFLTLRIFSSSSRSLNRLRTRSNAAFAVCIPVFILCPNGLLCPCFTFSPPLSLYSGKKPARETRETGVYKHISQKNI